MGIAKLDAAILDDPKIAQAGVLGFALHVAAITWCCRNRTDGFVPRARVACLLDLEGVLWTKVNPGGVSGGPTSMGCQDGASAVAIAEHLCDVEVWRYDEDQNGYWLIDFLESNPREGGA